MKINRILYKNKTKNKAFHVKCKNYKVNNHIISGILQVKNNACLSYMIYFRLKISTGNKKCEIYNNNCNNNNEHFPYARNMNVKIFTF